MFYDTRTNTLLNSVPLSGYFDDGTLVQGLDTCDAAKQQLCGILPVKSDTPPRPDNSYEVINQRSVVVEDDGVVVTRVWQQNPPTPPVEPPVVNNPLRVSPRQIRLWLVNHDISLFSVDAVIDGIEDLSLREKTKIEWNYSPYVERTHPMIDLLGAALGLSAEQIDQAFVEAATL